MLAGLQDDVGKDSNQVCNIVTACAGCFDSPSPDIDWGACGVIEFDEFVVRS